MTLPRSAAVLMVLSLALAGTGAVSAQPADVMRVHFIDVGQGLAALVELPCAAVLIDAGGERWPNLPWRARFDGNDHLFPYLRDFFARRTDLDGRLDLLALTHPHADHTRGDGTVVLEARPDGWWDVVETTGAQDCPN